MYCDLKVDYVHHKILLTKSNFLGTEGTVIGYGNPSGLRHELSSLTRML
jgi:hypothetical protein